MAFSFRLGDSPTTTETVASVWSSLEVVDVADCARRSTACFVMKLWTNQFAFTIPVRTTTKLCNGVLESGFVPRWIWQPVLPQMRSQSWSTRLGFQCPHFRVLSNWTECGRDDSSYVQAWYLSPKAAAELRAMSTNWAIMALVSEDGWWFPQGQSSRGPLSSTVDDTRRPTATYYLISRVVIG